MLFDDEYVEIKRTLPAVLVAQELTFRPSESSRLATRVGEDGLPVHSFRTLLDDQHAHTPATICHTPLNPDCNSD